MSHGVRYRVAGHSRHGRAGARLESNDDARLTSTNPSTTSRALMVDHHQTQYDKGGWNLAASKPGWHRIHDAAQVGDIDTLREHIVNDGVDIDLFTKDKVFQSTPLRIACIWNQAHAARWLLKHKANIRITCLGRTLLMEAAGTSNALDVVKVLLECKADTTRRNPGLDGWAKSVGWTALDYARDGRHSASVQLLEAADKIAPAPTAPPAPNPFPQGLRDVQCPAIEQAPLNPANPTDPESQNPSPPLMTNQQGDTKQTKTKTNTPKPVPKPLEPIGKAELGKLHAVCGSRLSQGRIRGGWHAIARPPRWWTGGRWTTCHPRVHSTGLYEGRGSRVDPQGRAPLSIVHKVRDQVLQPTMPQRGPHEWRAQGTLRALSNVERSVCKVPNLRQALLPGGLYHVRSVPVSNGLSRGQVRRLVTGQGGCTKEAAPP